MIDADMHARAGDAELTPWLLLLDCAHSTLLQNFAASCATPGRTSNCATSSGTSRDTLSRWTRRTCALQELDPPSGSQTFRQVLLGSRVQLRTCQSDSSTAVLRQLLLSFVHTAAQSADSPQHRTAGWRFIDWNEVDQSELLTEAKRLLETGELFPRGTTAEEPHAPDAEVEASDSEPEAHVMEPLADDHGSDSDDAPTRIEESAAPAAPAVAAVPKRAAMSLLERLQAIRIKNWNTPPS